MVRKRVKNVTICIGVVVLGIFLTGKTIKAESAQESEKKEIEMYQVQEDRPNGTNDFYRTRPKVTLVSKDSKAVTLYRFMHEKEEIKSGRVDTENSTITFSSKDFEEGISSLEIWMMEPIEVIIPEEPESPEESENPEESEDPEESENPEQTEEPDEPKVEIIWQEVKDSRKVYTYKVDTIAPTIEITAPAGFGQWYTEDVTLSSTMSDQGHTGLASVQYYINGKAGQLVELTDKKRTSYNMEIRVDECSMGGQGVPVVVEVTDKAGNTSSMTRNVYLDKNVPSVTLEGCVDHQISGKAVEIQGFGVDENELSSQILEMQYIDVEGKKSEKIFEWEEKDGNVCISEKFQADGQYILSAKVVDLAGHCAETVIHFTIDKESPVIRYVEQLNGGQLQYFEWNYEEKEVVSDYTDYQYHMTMDCMPYQWKDRITIEGFHTFQVDVVDQAGNASKASAGFVIDHTSPKVLFGNVESGVTYEETALMIIELENKKDQIQMIEINGERQDINPQSDFFQFPFQEPGQYEVKVMASDFAGNKTMDSVHFYIAKKTTTIKKILKPIAKALKKLGITNQENEISEKVEKQKEVDTIGQYMKVMGIGIAILIIGLTVWVIYPLFENDNKKTPHKREDAK